MSKTDRWRAAWWCAALVMNLPVFSPLPGACADPPPQGEKPASGFEAVEEPATIPDGQGELVVRVDDARASGAAGQPLAVRAIVTASDRSHPDGAGRGVYSDGRFFADGAFTVRVPAGRTTIELRSGPNTVPLTITLDAKANTRTRVRAFLPRWFAPEERGWYSGDSHVHTQHDKVAIIKTDDKLTALVGRAQGLSYISQATKQSIDAADADQLSTPTFLYRNAAEQGAGAFIGHFTTPGISRPLQGGKYAEAYHQPLSAQKIVAAAHEAGGIVTYTHPMEPAHQLHWMGATEAYSDGVLGRCADAYDMESRRTEPLYFALLNLGNRLAVSGYTDSALERKSTLTPGDRRVYSHADHFDFAAIIQAIAHGRTFATNGGPVFPFFTIDGQEPGETLLAQKARTRAARLEIHSLYPLKSAELYRRGVAAHAFEVQGRSGALILTHDLVEESGDGWWLARVEDERGNWAITSPIYFRGEPPTPRPSASAILLEISNAVRMVELRREFFAHVIATVSPDDPMTTVALLKDGQVFQSAAATAGDHLADGAVPVTGGKMEYAEGWQWFPDPVRGAHFQADWPVSETGWYHLRVTTASGRVVNSDAVRFDASNPNSHEICVAHLAGGDTRLDRWGYGEELPLAEIRQPFEGDHWWYPQNASWRLRSRFGAATHELTGGAIAQQRARFQERTAP